LKKDRNNIKVIVGFGSYFRVSRDAFWDGTKDHEKLLKIKSFKSPEFDFETEMDLFNELYLLLEEELNKIDWETIFNNVFEKLVK